MKKLLFLCVLAILFGNVVAQDTILLYNMNDSLNLGLDSKSFSKKKIEYLLSTAHPATLCEVDELYEISDKFFLGESYSPDGYFIDFATDLGRLIREYSLWPSEAKRSEAEGETGMRPSGMIYRCKSSYVKFIIFYKTRNWAKECYGYGVGAVIDNKLYWTKHLTVNENWHLDEKFDKVNYKSLLCPGLLHYATPETWYRELQNELGERYIIRGY